MLLDELLKQNIIESRMFSLFIGPDDKPSKITIGGYDLDKFAKSDINWHNLASTNYWTLNLKSAFYGD